MFFTGARFVESGLWEFFTAFFQSIPRRCNLHAESFSSLFQIPFMAQKIGMQLTISLVAPFPVMFHYGSGSHKLRSCQ